MREIRETIKGIISDTLNISLDELDGDTSFGDDLGADWVDLEDIRIALRHEFGCEIEGLESIESIDDCCKLIKSMDIIR